MKHDKALSRQGPAVLLFGFLPAHVLAPVVLSVLFVVVHVFVQQTTAVAFDF